MRLRVIQFGLVWSLSVLTGCYVVRSGLHHNDLFNSRRPVEDVITDPKTGSATRDRLNFVARIMEFAKDAGLNTDGAYRYFIENKPAVVSYIVQAAYPDRLKPVTWWFPIVGRVPYLGFFKESDRNAKATELSSQGFDVDIGVAGAFSSLGWFDDPIFSSMLDRKDADIAHLFLHELVHRTVWISGSVAFNEQLAEYVAEVLTAQFIETKSSRHELERYLQKREDRRLFHTWLTKLRSKLEGLYEKSTRISNVVLRQRKDEIFSSFQRPPLLPNFRQVDYVRAGAPWNNSTVLASSMYAPDIDAFNRARNCLTKDERVSKFLIELVKLKNDFEGVNDPNVVLDGLCTAAYSAPANS